MIHDPCFYFYESGEKMMKTLKEEKENIAIFCNDKK